MSNSQPKQPETPPADRDTTPPRPALQRNAPATGFTVGAFVLLLLAIAANWRKTDSADLMFHMKVGSVIQSAGQVPNRDIFSSAASVEPWAYIEWLWARGLALVYQPAEWVGISVVTVLLALFTAVFTWMRSRKRGAGAFETAIIITVAAVTMLPVWQPTPDIAVVPLFLLSLLAVESRRLAPLVLLPFTAMLWANMHPAFILPLLAPMARLIFGSSVSGAGETKLSVLQPRMLLVVIIATGLLSAFINPHSANIYPAAIERLTAQAALFVSNPLEHFTDTRYVWQLTASVIFAALALAGRIGMARWQTVTFLVLAVFALTVTPSAITFLLVYLAAPAAAGLHSLMARTWSLHLVRHLAAGSLLLACMLLMPLVLLTTGIVGKAWGTGIRSDVFPEMPAGRMAAIPLRGAVFNKTRDGGYLVWRLWPGWSVVSDNRATLYNPEFYDQYEKIWQGASGWQAMFSLWRVYAVLGDNETARNFPDHNLYYELADSPDWTAVYWDKHNILYVKSNINLGATNLEPFRQLKPGLSWAAMQARLESPQDYADLAADLRRTLLDDPTNALAIEMLKLAEAEL